MVSVVHKIDARKEIERLRRHDRRVGIPASLPDYFYNFATGIVIDDKGHVITSLTNLDPNEKAPLISVVTGDGTQLPAKFVGLDCPSGFAVLEVAALKTTPPVDATTPLAETAVKIVSTSVATKAINHQNRRDVQLSPSLQVLNGRIENNNVYARLRGALMLRSPNFLSRNDGAIVTTNDNQLIGLAQFAGVGRAYLFPITLLRDTIARRVILTQKSVSAGWLGVTGVNLFQLSAAESSALNAAPRSGIFVKEVNAESPAAKSGIKAQDVLIGFNDFTVTNTGELGALLSASPAGEAVKLRAIREGKPIDFEVVLGAKEYTEPVLRLEGAQVAANSQESLLGELLRRLEELSDEHRRLGQTSRTAERAEALRELTIEIREIQDSVRALQAAGVQAPEPPPLYTPVNRGQTPKSCQLSVGFLAREMTSQLAEERGTPKSVWVIDVKPGSAAEAAGLQAGDVVVSTRGEALTCTQVEALFTHRAAPLPLTVLRKKQTLTITIKP